MLGRRRSRSFDSAFFLRAAVSFRTKPPPRPRNKDVLVSRRNGTRHSAVVSRGIVRAILRSSHVTVLYSTRDLGCKRPRSDMCPACCYRDICGVPQVAVSPLFSAQWRKFSGGFVRPACVFFLHATCEPSLMVFRRRMTPCVRQMTRRAERQERNSAA